MASTENIKEQQESNDTAADQAPVFRQKQPSVDSTGGPQVPVSKLFPNGCIRKVQVRFSPHIFLVTPQDVTRAPYCYFSAYKPHLSFSVNGCSHN